ncbi:AraC family transcriptional regulator [Streptomyces parvulus]|uniref:AraC family transcriptional regulator n=1 Tax=Streptomyces parvulus TaxID=146923 RepID=UPI0037926C49
MPDIRQNQPDADPPAVRHTPVAPTRAQRLTAGRRIDAHRHDEHQIVYAGSGVVAVTTDAGTWFAPGTRAIWIPARTVHAHRAHGRLDLHLVGLPGDACRTLDRNAPVVLAVGPLLRELILAYTRDPADAGPERRRLLAVLCDQLRASPQQPLRVPTPRDPRLAVLCDQLRASPQQPLRVPTPRDPRLAAVCDLVHADPAEVRTLAELGAATGTGERTLSRLFRGEFGMTFPQWRTQSRLYHALRLLADGLPVTTVAHRCGWSSASAFIEVFRRSFGYTPGTHNRRS